MTPYDIASARATIMQYLVDTGTLYRQIGIISNARGGQSPQLDSGTVVPLRLMDMPLASPERQAGEKPTLMTRFLCSIPSSQQVAVNDHLTTAAGNNGVNRSFVVVNASGRSDGLTRPIVLELIQ